MLVLEAKIEFILKSLKLLPASLCRVKVFYREWGSHFVSNRGNPCGPTFPNNFICRVGRKCGLKYWKFTLWHFSPPLYFLPLSALCLFCSLVDSLENVTERD